MMTQYCCPTCQAKSRFNVLEQSVKPVKVNWQTGDLEEITQLDPFHLPYQGPERRIHCASCGQVDDELRFVKMAEKYRTT